MTSGARVTVTIRASNYGAAGGVTETLPAGFSYVNSSLDAAQVSKLANNQVRFTLQGDSSFTYNVTASDTPGSYRFSGTLRDADRNDHTVGGSTRIAVRSSSGGGGGGGGTPPPANRAPVFSEGSSASRSVAENSAAGTVVGSPVTATDRDGDRLTYRLSGTDESLFSVDASTGQVSVAQGTALDFEVKNSYAVSVRASDPSGSADNISITIRVSNVDEDGQVTLSPQQPKIGTELSAALTDPDGSVSNTSWTWERSTDNTAWAAIAGARSNTYTPVEADEGQYLRAAVAYTDGHGSNKRAATGGADRVTVEGPNATRSFSSSSVTPGARVTVTIRASDYGAAGGVTETLPAGFSYVNSDLDAAQVSELGNSQVRFTLQGDSSFTYTVTASGRTGSYTFSGTLRDADRNDHTVGGSTRIAVRSSSGGGGGGGGGGTPPPANRAPVFSEGSSASRSVAENSAAGTVVGSPVTATDRDGDRLTYRLSGTDESLFSVDASTGQVSVAQGMALDFEVKNSFAVSVRASDPSGSADNISITIRVSNVDEDGQVTLSPQQPKIGTELSAALTDPDGSVSNTSWTWERSTDNTAWAAIAGARSNTYTPVEADEGQYLRAAVAYTDGHGSNKRAATGGADRVTATATPEPTATTIPEPTATATPEPTATATPEPTATATPEPTATATPEPTATATPEPTATATPEPTATAIPEPTATAIPEPTATAIPEVVPPVEPEEDGGFPVWAIVLIIIGVLAAGAIGFYVIRKRS